ncbi:uncharacterized protein [Sinocyclocheilus grahami]|uniref:uncharacterized protein isoform X3 n=1 Tax=Sinocyclocheilus grahami TaxID=75366 RepID=UPI0007AC8015|nr:PREDICTED: uncharacterized protein LOC107593958 isoform X3 [Sinocyclocheilus grahami]
MDGPVDGIKLIRRHKTELLEALTGDPDVLLQRCHASGILSNNEYNNIKDTNMRSKQVRDILDYVIDKDNKHALNFLKLLKTQDMQETFPKLHFLQKLQINKRKTPKNTVHAVIDFGLSETTAKRRQEMENEPLHSRMVSEKEMMMVAGCIGNSWRERLLSGNIMATFALSVIGLEAELCIIPLHGPVIKQHLVLPDFMESFAVGL